MNRWRGLPLQLFVLIVLPLTVLLLAIAFGSLAVHQRAMRAMVGERDERATRAAAAAISEQIDYRQAAIRGLALQAETANDPHHALIDAAFLLPYFEGGLALLTADGTIAAADGPEDWERRLATVGLAPFLAEGGGLAGPVADSAGGGDLMIAGATAGDYVAVGAFSPSRLTRQALADIFGADEPANAYVVDAEGALVYQTGAPGEGPPGASDALLGENGAASGSASGSASGATYRTVEGEELVVAYSPIQSPGWALVIEEPWREVADPLLRATELAPIVLIPALLIALAALWFGVRQVVQPLQSLERQATALGWGDFTAIEEPVGGINEIRRLQVELIHMARKVSVAQQSLRGYLGAITVGQEEERRRLARELHDETMQALIALNQQIQLAQIPPAEDGAAAEEGAAARLATMQAMVEGMIADLRRLTRDLRPIYLEDLGLIPALDILSRDMSRLGTTVVTFECAGPERRLPAGEELALYRIAQESLRNVLRHAQAGRAEVCLAYEPDEVRLTIQDDGVGFVTPESPGQMAAGGHYGLLGIQERAEAIGARMVMESSPGNGTRIAIHLPTEQR